MPDLYILIGLPASGKSTWVNSFLNEKNADSFVVVSSDAVIEQFAEHNKVTYDEMFKTISFKMVNKIITEQFEQAVSGGKNIIVDRTNLNVKARRKWLDMATNYNKVAVVFDIDEKTRQMRAASRANTGKFVPDTVIDNMAKSYQAPICERFNPNNEFDKIIKV